MDGDGNGDGDSKGNGIGIHLARVIETEMERGWECEWRGGRGSELRSSQIYGWLQAG